MPLNGFDSIALHLCIGSTDMRRCRRFKSIDHAGHGSLSESVRELRFPFLYADVIIQCTSAVAYDNSILRSCTSLSISAVSMSPGHAKNSRTTELDRIIFHT